MTPERPPIVCLVDVKEGPVSDIRSLRVPIVPSPLEVQLHGDQVQRVNEWEEQLRSCWLQISQYEQGQPPTLLRPPRRRRLR